MKKRFALPIAAVAIVGLMASFATTASAFPSKTTACTGCHDGANVAVTAALASTVGSTATYNVSAPGADSVAVFDGATKIFTLGATGQFSVATGKTYTLYAVAGPGTSDGIGSTTVSPVGAPVDATAPVTVSDAKTSYVSSAAIKLTATDVGTGVANTYYVLDGGLQITGTTVNVTALGAHTLQFWSVDKAGNAELRKTAAFTITAPVVLDTTAPATVSDAKASYVSSAAIKLTATDAGSGVAGTYYKLDGGAQVTGTSVNVTALGAHTLEFWSADVAGNIEVHKTTSFTITAPVVLDTTAPVTTSDAKASYVTSATVKLTASDAGTGVAATYYKLDGGIQVAGNTASVTTTGTHTIEFWSTDKAGNTEAPKTASFTVTDPAPVPDGVYTYTTRVSTYYQGRLATLTNTVTGAKYTAVVGRRGSVTFTNVPAGTYRLSIASKRGTRTLNTITVPVAAPAPSLVDSDRASYWYGLDRD